MASAKTLGALIALLTTLGAAADAKTLKLCREPKTGSNEAPMLSPAQSNIVLGKRRLQFYSAPSFHCLLSGVFVIPGDQVIAYAQTLDGWSSVNFMNSRTGDVTSGWVRTSRLKVTGDVGPRQ